MRIFLKHTTNTNYFFVLGGNGVDGKKGPDSSESEIYKDCPWNYSYEKQSSHTLKFNNGWWFDKCVDLMKLTEINSYRESYGFPVFKDKKTTQHLILGKPGDKGGDAGKGGCGGSNGFSGKYIINEFDQRIDENNHTIVTKIGRPGKPGNPGNGGFYGDTTQCTRTTIKETFTTSKSDSVKYKSQFECLKNKFESEQRSLKGFIPNGCFGKSENRTHSNFEFYGIETEYLNFTTNFIHKLKLTHSSNKNFSKKIIDQNYFKPKIFNLTQRVSLLNNKENFYLLENLKNEITDSKDTIDKENNSNSKNKHVLNYLLASISSTILRQTSGHSKLVLDAKKYIEISLEQIKNLETFKKQILVDVYKTNFENNIQIKIEKAIEFIKTLEKDIDQNIDEINKNLKDVSEEIVKMKSENKENESNLKKIKEDLQGKLVIKSIFGGLKVFSGVLSILGPTSQMISSGLNAGLELTEGLTNMNSDTYKPSTTANLDKNIEGIKKIIHEKNAFQFKEIKNELIAIESIKNTEWLSNDLYLSSNSTFKTVLDRIDKLPVSEKMLNLKRKCKELLHISKEKTTFQENAVHQREIKDIEEKIKTERIGNKIDKVVASAETAKLTFDLVSDVKLGHNEIMEIENEIKKNSHAFLKLQEFEEQLQEFQFNTIKEFHGELNVFKNNFKEISLSNIDFKKWEVKKYLIQFRNTLETLLNNLEGKKQVLATLDRIYESISSMINIYDKIENFKQQSELAVFISNTVQSTLNANDIPEEYKNEINKLEIKIYNNIIMERYIMAQTAFNYWSFPFYFKCVKDNLENPNLEKTLENVKIELNEFLNYINEDNIGIRFGIDNLIHDHEFKKDFPFYKWSTKNGYSNEIKKLLRGETAYFYADINHAEYDAIKFKTLYVLIEIVNSKEKNQTLNNLLVQEKIQINMTHSGLSHYKFDNEIISINSVYESGEKLMLIYEYSCFDKENCYSANQSYKKLSKNKPVLSPYTFWEFRIKNRNSRQLEISDL